MLPKLKPNLCLRKQLLLHSMSKHRVNDCGLTDAALLGLTIKAVVIQEYLLQIILVNCGFYHPRGHQSILLPKNFFFQAWVLFTAIDKEF